MKSMGKKEEFKENYFILLHFTKEEKRNILKLPKKLMWIYVTLPNMAATEGILIIEDNKKQKPNIF